MSNTTSMPTLSNWLSGRVRNYPQIFEKIKDDTIIKSSITGLNFSAFLFILVHVCVFTPISWLPAVSGSYPPFGVQRALL